MARYFFNIHDGEDAFDDTGTDLHGEHEMQIHMIALAQTWIEREEHQHTHRRVEARDEDENLVGSVRFGVVTEIGNA